MNVRNLIKELKKMPPDLEVKHVWDGSPRTTIEFVWLAKDKSIVVTADFNEPVYDDALRPQTAPNEKEDDDWYTPEEL